MAVEHQTPPAQPASSKPTMSRDFVQVISAAAALVVVMIAGMSLIVSMAVTPLRDDMRLLRDDMRLLRDDMRLMQEDMRLLRADMQRGFKAVDDEFKAVRGEITTVREDMNNEFKAVREDMNDEFKAVRKDLATLNERLTRLETLLGQGASQAGVPEEPAVE